MFELKDISLEVKEQNRRISILKNINLKLEKNKIYAITGPNGGGKSSLSKLMMGIYKPISGKILFDGKDITDYTITQRAALGIGYAFQQPAHFKGMTVRELLEIANRDSKKKIDIGKLLIDVGLCAKDYIDREVNGNLSGGEIKRVEIASVIARDLELAIFDEPEAGIDLWSFEKLVETLKNLHNKYNTTLVIISHQKRIIELADEVIVVSKGVISKKVFKDEIIKELKNETLCNYCKTCEGRR